MVIARDVHCTEAALIHCALSGRLLDNPPAPRMGSGEPVHEPREGTVYSRRGDQMPMIGHQTVRKHRHVTAVDCLKENAFERGVVVGAFEQWNFLRGSIHEM